MNTTNWNSLTNCVLYRQALRNIRALAVRHEGETDWDHVLRFCEKAHINSSLLRNAEDNSQDVDSAL